MSLNSRFKENVNKVVDYLTINGGIEPRKNEMYKGICPHKIITQIRKVYCKGERQNDGSICYDEWILYEEEISKLKEIKFDFNIKTYSDKFDYNLEILKEYLIDNDFASIKRNTIYKNFYLGEWVHSLRKFRKLGKKNSNGDIVYRTSTAARVLTKEQIEKLDNAGFIWNPNSINIKTKEEYLQLRKSLHIQLGCILKTCKNQIKTENDVKKINKKLIKKLD